MEFNLLTPNAEKLLREILDNRFDDGNCDTDYWESRFEGLSIAEDTQLRSTFKELSDAEMISTQWADDVPYMMTVLNKGLSYFVIKDQIKKEQKRERRSSLGRDIVLLVVGAVIGAVVSGVVTYFLFITFGIGG